METSEPIVIKCFCRLPRCITTFLASTCFLLGIAFVCRAQVETLPPLDVGQKAPENFEEMWNGFDPQAEPLDIEVLEEWEEDGVILRVVRFHIGFFKGKPAKLAAIYGFPKSVQSDGEKLPGLLQIHGGGQYADHRACVTNGKRGYATLSIAWAGRISSTNYRVNADGVKLFWDNKVDDPKFRLTTDWGALDAYHAPTRNPKNNFPSVSPADWTLDSVESPRNSPWFLCALAARRGLTFLERQKEVDPDRLGVYGHSMGGKLTVLTSVDPRVKASAPSCGGISDFHNRSLLFQATVDDRISLKEITCPIFFLSPSNDFHGRIGDLPNAIDLIKSKQWRATCSPHLNHKDLPEYYVATQLWFDEHLKERFKTPQTPQTSLQLENKNGTPVLTVTPDTTRKPVSIDVYYTQGGKHSETPQDRIQTKTRFWHHVEPKQNGKDWVAELPLESTDKPLWAYANVTYELESPIEGSGYYYATYTADKFVISSLLKKVVANDLVNSKCQVALHPQTIIEDFESGWQKDWIVAGPNSSWSMETNKLNSIWAAPDNSSALEIQVRSEQPNKIVVKFNDDHTAVFDLTGGKDWQTIRVNTSDALNFDDEPIESWKNLRQVKLSAVERQRGKPGSDAKPRTLGKPWEGPKPEFKILQWTNESKPENTGMPGKLNTEISQQILNIFPESTRDQGIGKTSITSEFQTSKSIWAEGLDERKVFLAELQHEQDSDKNFDLRIGKGGQIYSLRGNFGESVPPSFRLPNRDSSPWNDEVWQFVAVCTRYNGLQLSKENKNPNKGDLEKVKLLQNQLAEKGIADTFFIHNSGAYVPQDAKLDVLYCPLLAWTSEDQTFRMVNWGLVPQLNTIHRSPLLFYTQVRDAGDGIIELTWVVHNFSVRDDVVFDHLNAPWGGTRISSLPLRYVSTPDQGLIEREDILNKNGVVEVRKTGGWNLSCRDDSQDSPSLALVYGIDKHYDQEMKNKADGKPYIQFMRSLYRDWRASKGNYDEGGRWQDWKTRAENSFRNYDVCEIIPRLRIEPQKTIWFRSYLVVGPKENTIATAQSLVDHVDYGSVSFAPADAPSIHYRFNNGELETTADSDAQLSLYSQPVEGTRPLFLIRNQTTMKQVVTTDPYLFIKQENLDLDFPPSDQNHEYFSKSTSYSLDEHNSNWESLLGFAFSEKPAVGQWQRLSDSLESENFPSPTEFHLDLWVPKVN